MCSFPVNFLALLKFFILTYRFTNVYKNFRCRKVESVAFSSHLAPKVNILHNHSNLKSYQSQEINSDIILLKYINFIKISSVFPTNVILPFQDLTKDCI